MSTRSLLGMLAGALLLSTGWNQPAVAEWWMDSELPLTWRETLACPLVVVAKYESHQDKQLTLKVVEVLQGKYDPAQSLTVRLEHLYSVETRPVAWEAYRNKDDDGIPRLCYKTQLSNPGDLVPVAVRSDARQPAIYFFRDAARPVLKVRGQVQSPLFQQGWQQALDGKPMDLIFRLMQQVNSELARDALEELGKSRDPQCLDQLFQWVVNRMPDADLRGVDPTPLLVRLGDQGGDVYGRAAKLMTDAAPGENEYRFGLLARIMVVVDPDRAWPDLPKLMKESDSVAVKNGALTGIGRIARRDAAQLALEALCDPELAQHASWAIRGFIFRHTEYEYPRFLGFTAQNDRSWLLDELVKAGRDERIPEKIRKDIQSILANVPGSHAQADLPALRTLLLNKAAGIYRGRSDRESERILRQATEACDPDVIPIIAEALQSVPAAARHDSYSLAELAFHYATICPRALRKELEAREIPARLAAMPWHERNHKIRQMMETVGLWAPEDRAGGEDDVQRCFELARQIRSGKPDQLNGLLDISDRLVKKGQYYAALPALLDCESPVAREHLLSYIEKAKEGRPTRWSHERSYGSLTSILYALRAKREMHGEVAVELLRSKSLPLRKAGVESLQSAWQCDFDFDPAALEAERTRKHKEIEPLLRHLASVSEPQARVVLLARSGVTVIGEPSESWLPTLIDAVGQAGNAAPHALRLVEVIAGEERARKFEHFPPEQRQRALRAYLQDLGKLAQ